MYEGEVARNHLPEEDKSTGAVRKDMKHLQIDAVFVVSDPVEQILKSRKIKRRKRRLVVLGHGGGFIQAIQVIPEKTLAECTVKVRKFHNGILQRVLENIRNNRLLQLTDDAKDTGVKAVGGAGDDDGCIIKFVPFPGTGSRCCFHSSMITQQGSVRESKGQIS